MPLPAAAGPGHRYRYLEEARSRRVLGPEAIRKVDAGGMYAGVSTLPQQLREGLALGEKAFRPVTAGRILALGMGASGTVGDLLASWCGDRLPVVPVRDYRLPRGAGRGDFALAISFSGDTEETLAAFHEALDAGCPAAAVTTGGRLQALCHEKGVPCAVVPRTVQARAGLGLLLGPVAALLGQRFVAELRGAAAELEAQGASLVPGVDPPVNKAKTLAAAMQGHTVGLLADAPHMAVARRWAAQLHENEKVLAWASELPEADHNEIVAWAEDPGAFLPILLRGPDETPELRRRLDLTAELLAERRPLISVELAGPTHLARLLGGVQLADFASLYLAVLRGIDPTPQQAIDELKRRLRRK